MRGNFSCVQKWVGLENKNSQQHKDNSLKQLKTAKPKIPWPYIREGSLSGSFSPRGLIFVLFLFVCLFVCFFRGGEWGEGGQGLIIGILRHVIFNEKSFRLLGIRVKTSGASFSKFPKSPESHNKNILKTLCLQSCSFHTILIRTKLTSMQSLMPIHCFLLEIQQIIKNGFTGPLSLWRNGSRIPHSGFHVSGRPFARLPSVR